MTERKKTKREEQQLDLLSKIAEFALKKASQEILMARHSAAPGSPVPDSQPRTSAVGRADLLRFLADQGEARLDAMAACARYARIETEVHPSLRVPRGPAAISADQPGAVYARTSMIERP